jgi:plasmid maintenance system antidote protein VapI
MVHPENVATITRYVERLEQSDSTPWREVAAKRGSVPASVLRGARGKSEVTQTKLSELTGIPQRHISEMERGKRPIGKETARKLAAVLDTDYRVFL